MHNETKNTNFRIKRRQVAVYFNDGQESTTVWAVSLEAGLKDKKLLAAIAAGRSAFMKIWLAKDEPPVASTDPQPSTTALSNSSGVEESSSEGLIK